MDQISFEKVPSSKISKEFNRVFIIIIIIFCFICLDLNCEHSWDQEVNILGYLDIDESLNLICILTLNINSVLSFFFIEIQLGATKCHVFYHSKDLIQCLIHMWETEKSPCTCINLLQFKRSWVNLEIRISLP